MWTCSLCQQKFLKPNQSHSCNDRTIADFLEGKPAHTIMLYNYLVSEYKKIGEFELHPAKSRISFAATTRFGAIHQLGKNFIDLVFWFNRAYMDNLCFHKIAQLPGKEQYNHYFRMYETDDLNDEIRGYMKMAQDAATKQ